jgi:hypothetical protein
MIDNLVRDDLFHNPYLSEKSNLILIINKRSSFKGQFFFLEHQNEIAIFVQLYKNDTFSFVVTSV